MSVGDRYGLLATPTEVFAERVIDIYRHLARGEALGGGEDCLLIIRLIKNCFSRKFPSAGNDRLQ